MRLNKNKILQRANRCLKRTPPYQEKRQLEWTEELNYQLLYVLVKGPVSEPENIMVYAGMPEEQEGVILFFPGERKDYVSWKDAWGFNFERDLFDDLEDGYDLLWMSDDTHVNVWFTIDEWKDEIEAKDGMQKYLEFCVKNGINKRFLQEEFSYKEIDAIAIYGKENKHGIVHKESKKIRKHEPER